LVVSTQKKFRGCLEPDHTALKWTIVRIPFDPTETWPSRKGLRVKGSINGFPFRTSLLPYRRSGYLLIVNKKMQAGAGVRLGETCNSVLEPGLEERATAIPPELMKLLKQDRALKRWFESLNGSMKKYITDQVSEPKSPAARVRRAELMAERMMLAMEGEIELPPVLQVAFRRQPLARPGWDAMTALQRRGHLLGIFYYQSPESRQKRAEKAVGEAFRVLELKRLNRRDSPSG
jgi:uncharacterized protein YdeI (YjbR/CyaY-like superfamily)